MSAPLLKVDDLAVTYSAGERTPVPVLDGVSFEIAPGEVVGLLGASGCGKSTLALTLLRLLPPAARLTRGSMHFKDYDLLALPQGKLRKVRGAEIAVIFQEPTLSLNPVRRVGDQVADVIAAHRDRSRARCQQEALSALSRVHLTDTSRIYASYPHQLSGGQRQRVAIAQAIACKPSLIIADEPTASLDPSVQMGILDLFREMNLSLQTAILLISHDPAVLGQVAGRLMVLDAGRIVDQGTPSEVYGNPQHSFTRAERKNTGEWRVTSDEESKRKKETGAQLCSARHCSLLIGHCPSPSDECEAPTDEKTRHSSLATSHCPSPLLAASGLNKVYVRRSWFGRTGREVRALDGVDLDLFPGETLALVGESGSGKSTLARCLACLEEPTSGEIRFRGTTVPKPQRRDAIPFHRHVQLIFQDPATALNPRLTAAEIISEPLAIHRPGSGPEQLDHAVRLMEQVGLDPATHRRRPLQFSGGQRQRLAIARALALEPAVLILDEALSGLDLPVQAQILELLGRLQSERALTYLFITHDLMLAARIADEIAVMYRGAIVERARPDQLFCAPRHVHTRTLVESVPQFEAVECAM